MSYKEKANEMNSMGNPKVIMHDILNNAYIKCGSLVFIMYYINGKIALREINCKFASRYWQM